MANMKNLAADFVATAPSPATSGLTLDVRPGRGAAFPSTPFYATLTPPGQLSTTANSEIVLVTAVSTDTFTMTRAQKGTTAQSIGVGWIIANSIYNEDVIQLAGDLGGTYNSPAVMIGRAQYYNLVPNPSFEVDYTNWKTYGTFGTIVRDTTDSYSGTVSSKQTDVSNGDGGIQSNTLFALNPGTYTFSVWAKISSGIANANMILRGTDGVKVQINQTYPGNTNWNRYSATFTVPTAGYTYEILLGLGSYGGGATIGTVSYDAVQIELNSTATTYFDGSFTNTSTMMYTWTGAAGTSQSLQTTVSQLTTTDQLIEGSVNPYHSPSRAVAAMTNAIISPNTVNTSVLSVTGPTSIGSGGFRSNPVLRNANVTLSATSSWLEMCNATTASFTITLPAANASSGQILFFKKIDSTANTVTIQRAGTNLIDGQTSIVLSTQYKYVEIFSDNSSNWYIRGNN